MIPKKAISLLKSMAKNCNAGDHYDDPLRKKKYAALMVALSAVDKQIPKKPVVKQDERFCIKLYCGNCEGYYGMYGDVHIPSSSEFCPYCGQQIDWSQE